MRRGGQDRGGGDQGVEGDPVIGPTGAVRVMVATRPVDFRKGAEGLAALVREQMHTDPFSGVVYVFRAKRADRIKLIFWDGTGLVLYAKRLEDGEFRWPKVQDGGRRANRGSLPKQLPRIVTLVDIEDCAERLDIVPAQLRVLVVRRPKYACRACEGVVVQAPAPARLIEGGIPTEAAVAHVVVGKYADHLPLYRQAQIYGRKGTRPAPAAQSPCT